MNIGSSFCSQLIQKNVAGPTQDCHDKPIIRTGYATGLERKSECPMNIDSFFILSSFKKVGFSKSRLPRNKQIVRVCKITGLGKGTSVFPMNIG